MSQGDRSGRGLTPRPITLCSKTSTMRQEETAETRPERPVSCYLCSTPARVELHLTIKTHGIQHIPRQRLARPAFIPVPTPWKGACRQATYSTAPSQPPCRECCVRPVCQRPRAPPPTAPLGPRRAALASPVQTGGVGGGSGYSSTQQQLRTSYVVRPRLAAFCDVSVEHRTSKDSAYLIPGRI